MELTGFDDGARGSRPRADRRGAHRRADGLRQDRARRRAARAALRASPASASAAAPLQRASPRSPSWARSSCPRPSSRQTVEASHGGWRRAARPRSRACRAPRVARSVRRVTLPRTAPPKPKRKRRRSPTARIDRSRPGRGGSTGTGRALMADTLAALRRDVRQAGVAARLRPDERADPDHALGEQCRHQRREGVRRPVRHWPAEPALAIATASPSTAARRTASFAPDGAASASRRASPTGRPSPTRRSTS